MVYIQRANFDEKYDGTHCWVLGIVLMVLSEFKIIFYPK